MRDKGFVRNAHVEIRNLSVSTLNALRFKQSLAVLVPSTLLTWVENHVMAAKAINLAELRTCELENSNSTLEVHKIVYFQTVFVNSSIIMFEIVMLVSQVTHR